MTVAPDPGPKSPLPPSARPLGDRMMRSAAWSVSARWAVRGIGFVSMIILARLLVPADFGLVALAMAVVAGLNAVSEFSFNTFLITRQDSRREHYDTVWTLSLMRGAVVALALYGGAEWFADFFGDQRLVAVIGWIALSALINGLENPGIVNFQKELRFSRDFLWMTGTKVGSFVVTVTLALLWRNYWALVAGIITAAVVRVGLSYVMHPFRPRLRLSGVREIASFSGWMLANSILLFVRDRSDQIILAKVLSVGALGLYSVAFQLASLIGVEVLAPLRRVLLPGFATVAHDRAQLARVYVGNIALIAMLMTPFAVGLGLTAAPIVRAMLGPDWMAAVPLVQALAAYAFFHVFSVAGSSALLALKRPAVLTGIATVTAAVQLPVTVLAAQAHGALGVAVAVASVSAFTMTVQWTVMLHILPLGLGAVLARLWRVLAALAAMAAVVLPLGAALPAPDSVGAALGVLLVQVLAGSATYVVVLLGLWQASGGGEGPERTALSFLAGKTRALGSLAGRKERKAT